MADTSFEELEDAGDGSSDGAQEAGDPQGPFSFLGEGSRAGFSMGSFLEVDLSVCCLSVDLAHYY